MPQQNRWHTDHWSAQWSHMVAIIIICTPHNDMQWTSLPTKSSSGLTMKAAMSVFFSACPKGNTNINWMRTMLHDTHCLMPKVVLMLLSSSLSVDMMCFDFVLQLLLLFRIKMKWHKQTWCLTFMCLSLCIINTSLGTLFLKCQMEQLFKMHVGMPLRLIMHAADQVLFHLFWCVAGVTPHAWLTQLIEIRTRVFHCQSSQEMLDKILICGKFLDILMCWS